jgi:hypothetical protein
MFENGFEDGFSGQIPKVFHSNLLKLGCHVCLAAWNASGAAALPLKSSTMASIRDLLVLPPLQLLLSVCRPLRSSLHLIDTSKIQMSAKEDVRSAAPVCPMVPPIFWLDQLWAISSSVRSFNNYLRIHHHNSEYRDVVLTFTGEE